MRIAYLCADPGVPVWGRKGCSIHVQGILRALVRRNMEVVLIALKPGGTCPPGLEPVALHLLDCETSTDPGHREQALLRLNDSVDQLLAALGPFDFVYERCALWSYAGMEFAQSHGIPGLLEVNAPLVQEQASYRTLLDRSRAVEATRRAFGAATAILPVSDEIAAHVREHDIALCQIHVLPNAVDPGQFLHSQASNSASDGKYTIGFVGSLKPWHGVDQLITAYASLWDFGSAWQLLITGDGPCRHRLEQLVAALPTSIASTIEFHGSVPHHEIPRVLASLNAAVAPLTPLSDAYFSPLKLFEYMAAGLPVVAARAGQIPALIRHGINGLLYNPGDDRDLANALLRLRADPRWAAQMGERARQDVLAHHTWDQRCDSILRIVQCSAHSPVPMMN